MPNKYRKAAIKLAAAICDLMNLLYKEKEAENFRHELFLQLQEIKFGDGKWSLKGGNHG